MASTKKTTTEELSQLIKAQDHVSRAIMGHVSMEHPGAPQIPKGSVYKPTPIEEQYIKRCQSIIFQNMLLYGGIFYTFPYLILRRLSQTGRVKIKPSVGGSLLSLIGVIYGGQKARMSMLHEGIMLDSPMGTEMRYQIWKRNPNHPFLKSSQFDHFDSPSQSNLFHGNQFQNSMSQNRNINTKFDSHYDNNNNNNDDSTPVFGSFSSSSSNRNMNTDDNFMETMPKKKYTLKPTQRNDNNNNNNNDDDDGVYFAQDQDNNNNKKYKRDNFYRNRSGQNEKSWGDNADDDIKQKWS